MSGIVKRIEGGSLPLAPKVAATRKRFCATPSAGLCPGTHTSTVEVVV